MLKFLGINLKRMYAIKMKNNKKFNHFFLQKKLNYILTNFLKIFIELFIKNT